MPNAGFVIGDKAMIVAADSFYAYVDGWRGRVTGFQSGVVVLEGPGMVMDGVQGTADNAPEITLFVPAQQLTHTI